MALLRTLKLQRRSLQRIRQMFLVGRIQEIPVRPLSGGLGIAMAVARLPRLVMVHNSSRSEAGTMPGSGSWSTTISGLTPGKTYHLSFILANEKLGSPQNLTVRFTRG